MFDVRASEYMINTDVQKFVQRFAFVLKLLFGG